MGKVTKFKEYAQQAINKKCDVECAQLATIVTFKDEHIFTVTNIRGNRTNMFTVHAEENAIRKLRKSGLPLRLTKITTIRLKRDGSLANAKPCEKCKILLRPYIAHGLKVEYTNEQGEIVQW